MSLWNSSFLFYQQFCESSCINAPLRHFHHLQNALFFSYFSLSSLLVTPSKSLPRSGILPTLIDPDSIHSIPGKQFDLDPPPLLGLSWSLSY